MSILRALGCAVVVSAILLLLVLLLGMVGMTSGATSQEVADFTHRLFPWTIGIGLAVGAGFYITEKGGNRK